MPGGRAGLLELGGYRFDTGPTVLTMPDLIADALDCVGERLDDWLDLEPLDPLYRALLRRRLDARRARRRRGDGGRDRAGLRAGEAAGYRVRRLRVASSTGYEMRDFIDRNIDSPLDLLAPDLARLRGDRRLPPAGARRSRSTSRTRGLQRVFSFQAMYAGPVAVRRAGALRGDRLHGLGRGRVLPARRHARGAAGAGRRGREARRRVPVRHRGRRGSSVAGGRAVAVHTADGERIAVRRGRAQPRPAGRLPRPAAGGQPPRRCGG